MTELTTTKTLGQIAYEKTPEGLHARIDQLEKTVHRLVGHLNEQIKRLKP